MLATCLGRCMQNFKFFLHWYQLERFISFVIASRMPRRGHGQLLIFQLIASMTNFSLPFPDTRDGPLDVLFKTCQMATQGCVQLYNYVKSNFSLLNFLLNFLCWYIIYYTFLVLLRAICHKI